VKAHVAPALQGATDELAAEREALRAFLEFAREHKEIYRIIDEAEFVDADSYRQHYETTPERIRERLQAVSKAPSMYSSGSADSLTVRLAPVSDVAALSGKIDFGTVQSVDPAARVIRVKADATRLPAPLPPAVTDVRDGRFYQRNLEDLDSWDAGRRRETVTRLRDAPSCVSLERIQLDPLAFVDRRRWPLRLAVPLVTKPYRTADLEAAILLALKR
jgi:hypothetical protein